MSDVLLPERPGEQLLVVGRAAAAALDAGLREAPAGPGADGVEDLLAELAGHDTAVAVLPTGAAGWEVACRASAPVLLVPPGTGRLRFGRVLAPLDGTAPAGLAIPRVARFGPRDLLVLHVLDPSDPPRFWDQAAHAGEAWADAFLARWCDHPTARLLVRSGRAADQVVAVAREERPDLVVLGWAQHSESPRAPVVRRVVADADVPVLLVPVGGQVPGPSTLRTDPPTALP
ncbi:hypothetical protein GCM10023200_27630 [Actinomycetospora chlora]|uniref:UspA domain-containing protein n=1 Tax=Actinomycetospora chlora TaxID=663608 RepID=A0ABP9B805_9PSEU